MLLATLKTLTSHQSQTYTKTLNIKTNKCTNMYFIILKHTLKYLKSSYMFQSIDHHQGAHVVPC
jgi:hypothetical protein